MRSQKILMNFNKVYTDWLNSRGIEVLSGYTENLTKEFQKSIDSKELINIFKDSLPEIYLEKRHFDSFDDIILDIYLAYEDVARYITNIVNDSSLCTIDYDYKLRQFNYLGYNTTTGFITFSDIKDEYDVCSMIRDNNIYPILCFSRDLSNGMMGMIYEYMYDKRLKTFIHKCNNIFSEMNQNNTNE